MPKIEMKWYSRRIYARNTCEMALKTGGWQRCQNETGLIEVQIMPLYFDVVTQNYNRFIRVYTGVSPEQLARWGDMIEKEATRVWDEYQQKLNERVIIDLRQF